MLPSLNFRYAYSNLYSSDVFAIPTPLGVAYELDAQDSAEKANKAQFADSLKEANRQIGNMQQVLKNPNDPRIKTAFGPNANVAEISKVVDKLANQKLRVQSVDPNLADGQAGRPVNGFVPMENGVPKSARFGSTFFGEQKACRIFSGIWTRSHLPAGSNTQQQAGTIIHEATHQLALTGDHLDPTNNRIVPANEPNPANVVPNGGCKWTVPHT